MKVCLYSIDEKGTKINIINYADYDSVYNNNKVVKTWSTLKKKLYDEEKTEGSTINSYKMTRTITPSGDYKLYNWNE